jgi:hypothetical protein
MEILASLVEIAKDVALPVGVAVITARVTLGAGRQQIRAQAAERIEDRDEERQKRREGLEATAVTVRGEALESISDCIDQYTEDVRNQKTPTTAAVTRSLFRLSSRCSAEHLADRCRIYVEDAARAHDLEHAIEAMLDIRRRLVGWHIGHLTLEDTELLIRAGHEEILEHLALHHPDAMMR